MSQGSGNNLNRTGGSAGGGRAGATASQSGASNRLYSPSGRMRLSGSGNFGDGSPQGYSGKMGVNRVRREPAVAGSSIANQRGASNQSKSNSRTRAQEYSAKLAEQRRLRNSSLGSANNSAKQNNGPGAGPPRAGVAGQRPIASANRRDSQ